MLLRLFAMSYAVNLVQRIAAINKTPYLMNCLQSAFDGIVVLYCKQSLKNHLAINTGNPLFPVRQIDTTKIVSKSRTACDQLKSYCEALLLWFW